MPCYDPRPDPAIERLEKSAVKAEAMLCAVLRVLDNEKRLMSTLAKIDTDLMGLPVSEIAIWWLSHKSSDAHSSSNDG